MAKRSQESIKIAIALALFIVVFIQFESIVEVQEIGSRKLIGFPFYYFWVPVTSSNGADFYLLPFVANLAFFTIVVFLLTFLSYPFLKASIFEKFNPKIFNIIFWISLVIVVLPMIFLYFTGFIRFSLCYDESTFLDPKFNKVIFDTWFTWKNY